MIEIDPLKRQAALDPFGIWAKQFEENMVPGPKSLKSPENENPRRKAGGFQANSSR